MPTIKTSDLTGAALDWAVAMAEGLNPSDQRNRFGFIMADRRAYADDESRHAYAPSEAWAHGGPIIERIKGLLLKQWLECRPDSCCQAEIHNYEGDWIMFGPTPLIAAMRAHVASKLGAEVNVPEGLA